VVDILGVRDPVRGPYRPSLDDLRGIAFELPDLNPTELRLAGEPLPAGSWRRLREGGMPVIGFPLDRDEGPAPIQDGA
jgi:hypothetical protein